MHLSQLFVHPLKSAASLDVDSIEVLERGPAGDRRWMLVDPDGRFITGRKDSRMVLIRARPLATGELQLEAPGMPAVIAVAMPGKRIEVEVWKDRLEAAGTGTEIEDWLTRYLGRPARLVHMDAGAVRALASPAAGPGETVSFADGFPFNLVSQASLDGLNQRLANPVGIHRFRPNLVVEGCAAHDEDRWRRIRIGTIEFALPKLCTRCVFTTVDPATGERDANGEPLATLRQYRRSEAGTSFGINMLARGRGWLRRGDSVEVLEYAR